jgi:hypothetical protein
MRAQIKQLWIDRLRSGQDRQGCGYLHATDGVFCALGVLADLYVTLALEAEWVRRRTLTGDLDQFIPNVFVMTDHIGSRSASSYSKGMCHWADIDGIVLSNVIAQNDIQQRSFVEIADWIEETVPLSIEESDEHE